MGELIKSALEPVIVGIASPRAPDAEAKRKALLSIRVCDPACGSGHFLLAAAPCALESASWRAGLDTGEDEPAPERVRDAIREVRSHCIYGVDKNPLAVDLCRVALWLESHTADRPTAPSLTTGSGPGDSLVGVFDLAVLKARHPGQGLRPARRRRQGHQPAGWPRRNQRRSAAGTRGPAQRWDPGDPARHDFDRRSPRALDAIPDDSHWRRSVARRTSTSREALPAPPGSD